MDIRLRQLSYSSRLTLHRCPRKYQLYKLEHVAPVDEDIPASVTFAFGHTVGAGIQHYLIDYSETTALWQAFLMWEPDLLAEDTKRAKSFWLAVAAIQRFISMSNNGFLQGWELLQWNGKPAVELSFLIHLPNGFTYKGYVDAVLRHKETGEVMVLEVKTTSSYSVMAATYKNSAQAIGYSIVLDVLVPEVSSYQVKYLVYKTKSQDYESPDFIKTYLQRALWIRELLLDVEMIQLYEEAGIYPMHGESCAEFFRECEYFGTCTLSTEVLTTPLTEEQEATLIEGHSDFEVQLTLQDLIKAQLTKEVPTL